MISKILIFIGFWMAIQPCFAQYQSNCERTGRTIRGCPMNPPQRGIPRLGDPVVVQGPPPPIPILDKYGSEMPMYIAETEECTAPSGTRCEHWLTIDIPSGFEYCVHNVGIQEWNHASYQVAKVTKNSVSVYYTAQYGSNYGGFDRVGANIKLTLIVGFVNAGYYNEGRCLPRRQWSKYCHGDPAIPAGCSRNERCATMSPVDITRDRECAAVEYYRRR